ncbi:hypothetical protein ACSSS7_005011 [Eimeria intestinalis]
MEAARASAASTAGRGPLRGFGMGAPSDCGDATALSPSLSHWLGGPASWLMRSPTEQEETLGGSPHAASLGVAPFLGSPTPGGAPGLRWLVSGWRRGDVPTNKFSVRPFAVAQQANLVDPKCCPFCCERRVAARFLREEVARLQAELEDLRQATHPALREKLTKFQQQHEEGGPSPSSSLPSLWASGSPQGVLTAAAAAASAALSAAAATAAEAVSEAFEGASCRGPRAVSFDLDELLLPGGLGTLEAAEPLPARRGPPRGSPRAPRRAASSPHPSSVRGAPLLTRSAPSMARGSPGPTGATGLLIEGAEAMVSIGRSLGASFTRSLSGGPPTRTRSVDSARRQKQRSRSGDSWSPRLKTSVSLRSPSMRSRQKKSKPSLSPPMRPRATAAAAARMLPGVATARLLKKMSHRLSRSQGSLHSQSRGPADTSSNSSSKCSSNSSNSGSSVCAQKGSPRSHLGAPLRWGPPLRRSEVSGAAAAATGAEAVPTAATAAGVAPTAAATGATAAAAAAAAATTAPAASAAAATLAAAGSSINSRAASAAAAAATPAASAAAAAVATPAASAAAAAAATPAPSAAAAAAGVGVKMMHGSHLDVESAENAPLLRRSGGLCPEAAAASKKTVIAAVAAAAAAGAVALLPLLCLEWNGQFQRAAPAVPPLRSSSSTCRHQLPHAAASNAIKNTKYSVFTFLPVVLFQQFRFFFNLFYLVVALAQLVPILQVGPLFTYLAPLAFVLLASLAKEAYDDIKRYVRDKELNGQQYRKLLPTGLVAISASDIRVGDVVQVNSNQRVPADLVFLKTTEKSGSCFIRTDQLDGETDWKLRRAVHVTQHLGSPQEIVSLEAQVLAEAPRQDIYEFTGRFSLFLPTNPSSSSSNSSSSSSSSAAAGGASAASGSAVAPAEQHHEQQQQDETSKSRRESGSVAASDIVVDVGRGSCGSSHVEPLGLENVLWANTVVASGSVFGLVIYTGRETRASMNASQATTKVGLFDLEVNLMSKILFGVLCLLSFALVALRGLDGIWGVYLCRFVLLLSSIIPISLQVNLIIAKTLHSINIMRDGKMAGSVVRSSTLPEELGRIDCLLTDKTGTLTQNEMHFKKLHIGRALFGDDGLEQLRQIVEQHYENCNTSNSSSSSSSCTSGSSAVLLSESSEGVGGPAAVRRSRRSEVAAAALEAVKALSICHNVTPIDENGVAASPDEVALVQFASDVGLRLVKRDEHTMTIQLPGGQQSEYQVLQCFPFSSEWKRMGIIVQDKATQKIFFYVKVKCKPTGT